MDGQQDLTTADFFILRTPTLPVDVLTRLRADFRERKSILSSPLLEQPLVREGLYLASHNLYARAFDEGADADPRLELSVARYLYRMATRPTPFGVFAGVTLGRIGNALKLEVGAAEDWRRICRIDQGVISRLQAALFRSGDLPLLRDLEIDKSNSLWKAPDGFRYVEAYWEGEILQYRLARMDETDALNFVISQLEVPVRLGALARDLASAFDTEVSGAENFLVRLLQEQVLVCLPQISVTGENAVEDFVSRLSHIAGTERVAAPLAAALRELDEVGARPERNIAIYDSVVGHLGTTCVEVHESSAIQVDLHKLGATPELPERLVRDMLGQIKLLRGLLFAPQRTELSTFAAEFRDRYGDATVPLLQALDADFGIRFGNSSFAAAPLIDGLAPRASESSVELGPPELILLRRAQDALQSGAREIALTDDDIASLRTIEHPSSFAVVGHFAVTDADALRDGKFLFHLTGVFGPSSCNLLGRFCCGNPDLTAKVKEFLATTEADTDDTIVAEVAHLPGGRVGNVLLRPVLRSYEIPYMGQSGAPRDRQIELSDLSIFHDDGRIVLFSRRLGKRVIPRITNAHAFFSEQCLPIYRFLGYLQLQGEPATRPLWGALEDKLVFLPGVRFRNIRLSAARWRLGSDEMKEIARSAEGSAAFPMDVLKRRSVGNRIRVRQDDNFLELDLSETLDRELFVEECRRHETLVIEDASHEHLDVVADAAGNPLRHEIVIPVSRMQPAGMHPYVGPQMSLSDTATKKAPGGDWLYAKIFCGPSVMDSLIANVFPEVWKFAREAGASKSFFLRYPEHGLHLRLRIQGPASVIWGPVRERLEQLLAPGLRGGDITRLEYATYQPELRRYGGEAGIEHCEHIFCFDSELVAAAIATIWDSPDREDERWKFALAGMVRLLRAFELGEDAELSLVNRSADAYLAEFGFEKSERDNLNDRYRLNRGIVDRIVAGHAYPVDAIEQALTERDRNVKPHIAALKAQVEPVRRNLIVHS
ncbi:MAG: lantibiotic dehydratase, partial [Rhizomicrobium sp.]